MLGTGASLATSDILSFSSTMQLLRVGCGVTYFTNFYNTIVSAPTTLLTPAVTLSGPTTPVSLCQPITISIALISGAGTQGLFNITWSLQSTNSTAYQSLTTLLQ